MKRLLTLVLAVSVLASVGLGGWADIARDSGTLPLSASLQPVVTWNANNFIILYIPSADMAVDLGTIDGTLYDPVSDTWTPLTSTSKNAYVIANVAFTLKVTAASTGTETADLTRFKMSGGDLSSFTALDSAQTLKSGSAGITHISDIQYRYEPSWADAAGDYAVTVTYTATAP